MKRATGTAYLYDSPYYCVVYDGVGTVKSLFVLSSPAVGVYLDIVPVMV
jgi:hypothetical protein